MDLLMFPCLSSYFLPHDKLINGEKSYWGKEYWLYLESQEAEKRVDWCPKESSYPGLGASFPYRTKRSELRGKVKRWQVTVIFFMGIGHYFFLI